MRRRGDDGASLIFALVIVTVIAVVVAVVMAYTDTSLRTTVAVRAQAAEAASADGAAQIAINALRQGTYDGVSGQCFGTGPSATNTLLLPGFYQPTTGAATSAAVSCGPDPALAGSSSVAITPANRPASALLTLGTGAGGEDGVKVDVADGRALLVHGGVFSNSTIAVPHGQLASDAAVTARGTCTGTVVSVPAPACAIGAAADPRGTDPNYPAPTGSTTTQSVPTCTRDNQLLTFTPGRYTDSTGLNNLQRCANTILYFQPGTYFFDLPDTDPWILIDSYIVGGTPTTALVAGTPPTIPGSCRSPVPPSPIGSWTPPPANSGVRFVFGGGSRLVLRSSQAELCGDYSATAPPIAVYGLKSAVGPVPAESGCTVATPYPGTGCAVIKQENQAGSRLYIQGTTYVPRAALDVALTNTAGLAFGAGVIARALVMTPTTGAVLTNPVIGVPDYVPIGKRTVLYLTVYVCPGAATCSTGTGTARLRVKVGLLDPTGTPVAGTRQMTVLSWGVVR